MNNNDLAALAALGAMGYMYKNHLDKQGEGSTSAAGPAGYEGVVPGSELGSQGNFRFGDAARDAGAAIQESNRGLAGAQRAGSSVGNGGIRARDVVYGGGKGGRRGGSDGDSQAAAGYEGVVPGSELGSQGNFRFSTPDVTSPSPEVAPEDSGMGGAGLAAGAGAAGAGAAAYYARLRAQARAMKPRAQTGPLSEAKEMFAAGPDKSPRPITGDLSETQKKFAEGPDRAAIAEAKSRATQAEIDAELKRYKNKTKGANDRAGVNKSAAAAGPTVTRETPTSKRAPVKAEVPTDMDDFNRMLRESKVGRATTATTAATPATPAAKTPKARGMAGKVGAALTLAGLGTAANAATNMTAGERERLGKDVLEGLITPLGLTPGMAGEGSDLYPSKPLSSAERKKNIETFLANASPADRKKYEEAVARQNPGLLDRIKRPSAANQRAAGGQIKAKKMASGGMTSTVSSASKRGDGIASKGKTRCKMY
jgi:hypothetical protein